MENAINVMTSLTPFLLPLANASDTQGLYSIVPKTIQRLMSSPYIQYFVLYFFVVGAGAEPIYAMYFVLLLSLLTYLENCGLLQVEDESDSDKDEDKEEQEQTQQLQQPQQINQQYPHQAMNRFY